jgi:hypothetical protein
MLYEIERETGDSPRTPQDFWDSWPTPTEPTATPLFMFTGHCALHLAAIWAEALSGCVAVGRLIALERPLQFCKVLSDQESEAWGKATISELSKHTKIEANKIDLFREVDFLQRKIDSEYLEWSRGLASKQLSLPGEQKNDQGLEIQAETTPNDIPPEFLTVPISKKKAAKLLGQKGNPKRAVEWLNHCIKDGIISFQEMSRQSGRYDIRQFPESVHKQLTAN